MKFIETIKPLFGRSSRSAEMKSFRGIGTVLVSDISNLRFDSDVISPEQLAQGLNTVCAQLIPIVRKHSGLIIHFIGDAAQAVWSEQLNGLHHPQMAFDAGCEILREFEKAKSTVAFGPGSIRIGLGTGDMAGEFFQPINQFQVLGAAPRIAEEVVASRFASGSAVLLTPETARLLKLTKPLREVGSLTRGNGEEFKVLAYENEA